MAKILVAGGAGYVGSAVCAYLIDRGHQVWVLDDLSRGRRALVLGDGFTHARIGDRETVRDLLEREKFDGAMHFCAFSLVAESVLKPDLYRENNVSQTRAFVETLSECGVRAMVFSSTAAVFGNADVDLISESTPKNPINPYGETKLEVESYLARLAVRSPFHSVVLRYFNAAGAELALRVGEWHEPETHLIPRLIESARSSGVAEIFGTDYATLDGTCVRDYIHVEDLAAVHEAALIGLIARARLQTREGSFSDYNLGSQNGSSVKEIVDATERVLGKKLERRLLPRRAGDPPKLVADSDKARRELGFKATKSLDEIIDSAARWAEKRSQLRPAIFLDRDGTINSDPGYVASPDKMELFSFSAEALAKLKAAGYWLIVVSNQSGVGRGLIREEDLPRIHDVMDLQLGPAARIDHYEFCMKTPQDPANRRKPKPDLLKAAAQVLPIDFSRSYMIGDRLTDLDAGRSAGCKASILVKTGEGEEWAKNAKPGQAQLIARDLAEAADWILAQK